MTKNSMKKAMKKEVRKKRVVVLRKKRVRKEREGRQKKKSGRSLFLEREREKILERVRAKKEEIHGRTEKANADAAALGAATVVTWCVGCCRAGLLLGKRKVHRRRRKFPG